MAATGPTAARKVLHVLLSLTEERPAATVRELAAAADVPLPTAHRYVALLRELGLLEEADRGIYQLGWRAGALARVAESGESLAKVAEPVMRELSRETGETVMLLELAEESMVCTAQVEARRLVRLSVQPGLQLPLSEGASARVLLAGMKPAAREATLDRLEDRVPGFRTRRERFAREVVEAAEQGWAVSEREIDDDVWAGAVGVNVHGRLAASLSIACPLARVDGGVADRLLHGLRTAAERIARVASNGPGTAL